MKRFILTAVVAGVMLAGGAVKAQPPSYLPGGSGGTTPTVPSLEGDRPAFFTDAMKKSFPRLGANFKVLAPASKNYNAGAYVLGVTDKWLWPEAGTAANPYAGMDRFLAGVGYRRLATFDARVQPGKQKVVIFATVQPDGDIKDITAAALQQADGTWACKIGGMALIQVPSLESLRGPSYGLAVAVYERETPVTPAPFGGR